MDLFIFLWALVATLLFILEKNAHNDTRCEYLEYRTKAEISLIIEDQSLQRIKPCKLPK